MKAYRKSRDSKNSKTKTNFPGCIGRFPECKHYTKDTPEKDRKECRLCR
jgi:hypothetical protein